MRRSLDLLLLLLLFMIAPAIAEDATDSGKDNAVGLELFEKRIRPALIRYCYECHSENSDEIGGELWLDSRSGWETGGDTGPSIVPGRPEQSLLIRAIEYHDLEMPPDSKMPEPVVRAFRRWVRLGAPDPRTAKAPPSTTPETVAKPVELWSIQTVQDPIVPVTQETTWPRDSIDHFILAKLEAGGLRPVADADPATLVRRVYFDLVGLPPPPEVLHGFTSDPTPERFALLVDGLLASDEFGKRWARHWLDVVRYGESAGSSRDVLMPYAWRYRDYVIDALNDDVPYDRFITEQVAGDLLEPSSDEERKRLRIATGMLAIGSKSLNGGNLTNDIVDDQIDVVSKSVLGLTVSCARCHDHKFDPIPTKDYYALAGIFLSTDTRYGGNVKRPSNVAEKRGVYLVLDQPSLQNSASEAEAAQQRKLAEQLERQVVASQKRVASLAKQVPAKYRNRLQRPIDDSLPPAKAKQVRQYQTALRLLNERRQRLIEAEAALPPEPDYAVGVQDAKRIVDATVLIRGEKNQRGERVDRAFLSAIDPVMNASVNYQDRISDDESGRQELADWLTDPFNPLTPRVAVNRIWQHLMGEGIVASVDNFGASGTRPSHPGLLDHLAHRFVHEHDWSIKSMIRQIVLSKTYQLSSSYDVDAYTADPGNRLRWRMTRRRLEAEPLRDAMLAVSGLLHNSELEGSLVMRIGEGEVGRNLNTKVLEQPFNHRSVYLPVIRGLIPEQLRLFDFPEPSNVQGKRDSNTTPTQSLFLMNSPDVVRISNHFATDLLKDPSLNDDRRRIKEAYLRCFSRAPTEDQITRAVEFLNTITSDTNADATTTESKHRAWTTYCQTLLASAPFRFLD